MLILLLVEINAFFYKKSCKENLVRIFGSGNGKIVFISLIEIVAV